MRILLACLVLAATAAAAELPADLVVATAPGTAVDVVAAKASAKPGDAVIIRARVGGRAQPFVAGRAVMAVVDTQAAAACDANPADNCPRPWDYCCEDRAKLKAALATVQVVDGDGRPLATGIEGAGGLKAGDRVIVAGTVAAGSTPEAMIVNATRLYIEPAK